MSDLHFEVLPKQQFELWKKLQSDSSFLARYSFYLAGGTALALQVGHRKSFDFDFFTEKMKISEPALDWAKSKTGFVLRETNENTLHAEINKVKVSFIGGYKYKLASPLVSLEGMKAASVLEIGLMKLLAITHRSTCRDYLDLALILRDHFSLDELLSKARRKYGEVFNPMIPLRALVAFEDLDDEMPMLIDKSLGKSWKQTLRLAVKKTARLYG